jgi:hypothetical protein
MKIWESLLTEIVSTADESELRIPAQAAALSPSRDRLLQKKPEN